jgi:hypothetical protein
MSSTDKEIEQFHADLLEGVRDMKAGRAARITRVAPNNVLVANAKVGISDEIPTTGLREFITDLAKRHGVTYVRDGYSALAEVTTRLSDDEVVPDETEKLVIALRRAEVIDGPTMVTLLGHYLDEQRERDTK